MTSASHSFNDGWRLLRPSVGAIAPSYLWRWARTMSVIIPPDLRPSILRNIDLHKTTYLPSFKGSKYSLDDSQPLSFCWLVLLLTSNLHPAIYEGYVITGKVRNTPFAAWFFIRWENKIFFGIPFWFFFCVLARFFFGPFFNILVDSRKGKLLDGVPMELSLDTSAGPWLMIEIRLNWYAS